MFLVIKQCLINNTPETLLTLDFKRLLYLVLHLKYVPLKEIAQLRN